MVDYFYILRYHNDSMEVNIMPDILLRNIPQKTLKQIKYRAQQHNLSVQQELKEILHDILSYTPYNISQKASAMRKKLLKKQIKFSDSTKLLREDRCR